MRKFLVLLMMMGCGGEPKSSRDQAQKVQIEIVEDKKESEKPPESADNAKDDDEGHDHEEEEKEDKDGVSFCLNANDEGVSKERKNFINYKNNDQSLSLCYEVIK